DGSAAGGLDIVGSLPRVVVRLDENAKAGEILVSADTWRLLRGEVECEPVGEIDVPEGGTRVPALRVRTEAMRTHPEGSASRAETHFVNRVAEVERVIATWRRVESGVPAMLVLAGEPGIGKSRLLRELKRRVPADAWLECPCAVESQTSPLQPIVTLLSSM